MEEKWKDTKYPNYEVSDLGNVRNKMTNEILRKSYNVVIINNRFRNFDSAIGDIPRALTNF